MIWHAQTANPGILVSDWERRNVYECIFPSDISKQKLLFPHKFPIYQSTVKLKLKFKINDVNESGSWALNDLTDCSGTITQFQINGYNTKSRPNLTVRITYQRSDISPSLTSLFTLEFRLRNSWVMALPSLFLPFSPFLTPSLLHFKALSFGQSQTFKVSVLHLALSNFLKPSLLYLVGSSTLSNLILHIQTLSASNA